MNIIEKIIITAILVMMATGVVALIGVITEKEKLCGIAAKAFFVEFFLLIIVAMIYIWITP